MAHFQVSEDELGPRVRQWIEAKAKEARDGDCANVFLEGHGNRKSGIRLSDLEDRAGPAVLKEKGVLAVVLGAGYYGYWEGSFTRRLRFHKLAKLSR